jgi:hypothetical protein
MASASDGDWRAFAVGAIIAGLGPAIGFEAVLAWVLWHRGPGTMLYLIQFPDVLITPYLFGGGPAAVAGLAAGWRIWHAGAISNRFWLAATAIFALVPSLLYLALHIPAPNGIVYVTDQEIAFAYIGAVTVALHSESTNLLLHRSLDRRPRARA